MNPDLGQYKAFLFDMGNTLLDFHAMGPSDEEKDRIGIQRFAQLVGSRFGMHIAVEECQVGWFHPWHEYQQHERKRTLRELDFCRMVERFLQQKNLRPTPEDLLDLASAFHAPHAEHVCVSEGVLPCLVRLKELGMRICVVSNAALPAPLFIKVFESQGLAPFIDSYHFSHSNQFMKPHPSLFKQALKACGCLPAEAMMIGDSYEADIRGAKRIGCITCLYGKTEEPSFWPEADFQVASFLEFRSWLTESKRSVRV